MKNFRLVPVFAVIYFLCKYQDPPPPPPQPIPDISEAVKNTFAEFEKNPQLDPQAQFEARQLYEGGVVDQNKGRHTAAIVWFDESIKICPTPDGYNGRAKSLIALNRNEQALADLNAAIAIDSKFAFAYWGRGTVKERMGDVKAALEDFTKAISLDPENPGTYVSRGSLYLFSLDEYQKSVDDFTKAVELDRANWSHYAHRGLAHFKHGHYELAIKDNTAALERMTLETEATDRARVYFARHKSYENLGDAEKSMADFDRAKELDASVLR